MMDKNEVFGSTPSNNDISIEIFGLLKPHELAKFSSVSKKWRFFTNHNHVWDLSLKNYLSTLQKNGIRTKESYIKFLEQANGLILYYNREVRIEPSLDVGKFIELLNEPHRLHTDFVGQQFLYYSSFIDIAIERGYQEMVFFLISLKHHLLPTVNPLFKAIAIGNVEIMQCLIGAGVNVTKCRFITEQNYPFYNGRITLENVKWGMCPLAYAICAAKLYTRNEGRSIDSINLLIKSGASQDDVSFPDDPLYAVSFSTCYTVTQLIKIEFFDDIQKKIQNILNCAEVQSYNGDPKKPKFF